MLSHSTVVLEALQNLNSLHTAMMTKALMGAMLGWVRLGGGPPRIKRCQHLNPQLILQFYTINSTKPSPKQVFSLQQPLLLEILVNDIRK